MTGRSEDEREVAEKSFDETADKYREGGDLYLPANLVKPLIGPFPLAQFAASVPKSGLRTNWVEICRIDFCQRCPCYCALASFHSF